MNLTMSCNRADGCVMWCALLLLLHIDFIIYSCVVFGQGLMNIQWPSHNFQMIPVGVAKTIQMQ